MPQPRIIAVANIKGGSGKTTTAVNVAAAMAERGARVLLLDVDPQASASVWLGVESDGSELAAVFTSGARMAGLAHPTTTPGLSVIPSGPMMARAERQALGQPGAELILAKELPRVVGEFDYVIIDTPPTRGLLTVASLAASSDVLVPCEASPMAMRGLVELDEDVTLIRERIAPRLRIAYVLPCRIDVRTNLAGDVVDALRGKFGATVCKTVIRESVKLREAWAHRATILQYDTAGHGAEDYRAVAGEVAKRK